MTMGFTAIATGKDVDFKVFDCPAERSANLMSVAQQEDLCVFLLGRFYYQADLVAQIPAEDIHGSELDEAGLALAMYRHFGMEGLKRLEGDFSMVIWSGWERRLVGMRDPMGGYPLFWIQQGQTIAVSTSLRPLRDLLPDSSLNLDFLAEFLMLPGCGVSEIPTEDCAYKGIHRVRPGTFVDIDLTSRRVSSLVYWNWLERMVDPGTTRLEEIGVQYGELLRAAVRERLRGRVACHFSGGMDSTSVALLANQELQSRDPENSLHALSLVYKKFAVLSGEKGYIREALRGQDGIVLHEVQGEDCLDFDVCADPPAHEEPWASLWRSGMNRALVDAAAQSGADTILTGFGADEMLHIPPTHITEMLRTWKIWAAWKEACRWGAAGNCSAWQFFYPFGLANLVPAGLRPGLGHLLHAGYAKWEKQKQWTIAPWILPEFARSYGLRGRAIQHLQRAYSTCKPVALSLALASTTYNTGDVVRWSLGTPRGLATAHPFFDKRLVCFGLGMQTRFILEPGPQKPVLGEAMRDILPESIRNRRLKAHCNEVYYLGMARNLPALEKLVEESPIDDLRVLNKDVLLSCLQRAALGVASDAAGVDRLTLTLSLLKWLSTQLAGKPSLECQSRTYLRWRDRAATFVTMAGQ